MKRNVFWGILTIFLCFWAWCSTEVDVYAADYTWRDGQWYVWELGTTETPTTAPEALTTNDVLMIFSTPDDDMKQYLTNLQGQIGAIYIMYSTGEAVIGQDGGNLEISGGVYSSGNAVDLTIYANTGELIAYKYTGTIVQNGNVKKLYLGSGSTDAGTNNGSISINGNVEEVKWVRKTSAHAENYDYFDGTVTVSGTVGKGTICEYLYDTVILQYTVQTLGEFANCNAADFSINSGVLSDKISVTDIDPTLGKYTYEYSCYGNKEAGISNEWTETIYSTDGLSTSRACTLADIPENAHVTINGTNEEIIIDKNLDYLCLLNTQGECVATVNGNVKELQVANNSHASINGNVEYASITSLGTNTTTISGDVEMLVVSLHNGVKDEKNLTIGGTVKKGVYREPVSYALSYFTCSNVWLVKDGVWNLSIVLNTSEDNTGIGFEAVEEDKLNAAVGDAEIGQTSQVTGPQGNVITIVKSADTSIQETKADDFAKIEQANDFLELLKKIIADMLASGKQAATDVLCAMDIVVTTNYKNMEDASVFSNDTFTSETITDLPSGNTLEFTVKVPSAYYKEGVSYKIVREHNGQYTTLEVVQNGDTLKFSSDKFSSFVIVEVSETKQQDPPSNPITTPVQTNNTNQTVDTDSQTEVGVTVTYTVVRGDTLTKIARKHGVSLSELLLQNPQIKNPNLIFVGQEIMIKNSNGNSEYSTTNVQYHIVQKGDNLYKIAKKNGLTLLELKMMNPELFKQKYIFVMQRVRIK